MQPAEDVSLRNNKGNYTNCNSGNIAKHHKKAHLLSWSINFRHSALLPKSLSKFKISETSDLEEVGVRPTIPAKKKSGKFEW